MNFDTLTERSDAVARRYDYGDEQVLVADLGVTDDEATVDVVEDTVILVVEDEGEPVQHEFETPEGTVEKAFINNGVVTVEVEL
ncbi:DUF7127 family protein [Halobacterium wangiae]|uniref:DUF7127 family protein n=1 Tax=Halobacterium wangiae TaxID=2902623 RepID=UPI001E2B6F8F|nr:hypothetical protein [Halobacterium wangiae]